MIRIKYLSIGLLILILTSFTLAGCGISQADYDALLAQKTALETEKQSLQTDYNSLQTENKALESEKATLEAEKQDLKTDYDTLQAENDTLKSDFGALQTEKDTLQGNYDTANNELTQIKEVYPPRDFSSRSELENWLAQNTISEKPDTSNAEAWMGRALEVQEAALLDGYIVSMDYDYNSTDDVYLVFCTTIINGYLWYWNPETDDITQDTSLIAVK
jgi:outer membrane murein-binding lipoprotein Lpp